MPKSFRLYLSAQLFVVGVSCVSAQPAMDARRATGIRTQTAEGREELNVDSEEAELIWTFWGLWSARLPVRADEIERLESRNGARWLEERVVFAQVQDLDDLNAIRPSIQRGVTLEFPAYALEDEVFLAGLTRLSRETKLHVIVRGRVVDATLLFLAEIAELRGLRIAADRADFSDLGLARIRSLRELRFLSARVRWLGPKGIGAIASLTHLRWLVLQSWTRDLSALSTLHQLESLKLSGGNEQLRMTSGMPDLEELVLDHSQVTDEGLATLGNLVALRTLRLFHTQVTGETLPILPQLRRLELGRSELSDAGLTQLSQQPRLESLDFSGTHVTDSGLSSLANLSSLRTLYALNLNRVTGTGLAALPANLTTLGLGASRAYRSPQLGHLHALESLRLYGTGFQNADLSALARLSALRELRLPELVRDDALMHLRDLPQLRTLNLGSVRLPAVAFEALAALTGLVELDVRGTDLSSLEPLRHLTRLENLNASNTSVEDLSPLAGLRSLTRLDLAATRAEDLSPLASLSHLIALGLSHNAISDGALIHLHTLPLQWLRLSNTSITDEGLPILAQIRTLKQLSLAHTQISDAGLLAFAAHPSLDMIDVEGTSVTGPTTQTLAGIHVYR